MLPELGEELGRYAERKLRERKVEVIKGARVASYDGWVVPEQRHINSRCDTHLDCWGETQSGDRGFAMPERERTDLRK